MPLKMRKTCKILSAFLGSFIVLIIILAYSQYLTLKKTLIAQLSEKATTLIGQKVEIRDLFLDPASGITIADISIRNPDNFMPGDLLKINKVRLDVRYSDLFKGRFSFRSIEVDSPQLSLMIADGRLNMSDAFRRFLSKKGTAEYLIDEFSIRNAGLSFNDDPLYRVKDMDMSLHDLSSVQGTKTSLKVSFAFWDSNRMTLEGWAYLKDSAQKFSISVVSDDINFSVLKKYAEKFGMDLDKSRAGISIQAEGDTDQGITIRAGAHLKSSGVSLFKKDRVDTISLAAEALLDVKKEALTISKALFSAGESSAIQAKGMIDGIFSRPSYSAEIKIGRLDLSSINLMKGLKANGIITSDLMQVKGTPSSVLPEAAGKITISNGTLRTNEADIQSLNGEITFASAKDLSAQLGVSGRILKAGDAVFRQPVEMKLAAEGKGRPGKVMLKAELDLSEIDMELKGKNLKTAALTGAYDGTLQGRIASGKASLEAKDISYDRVKAKNLRADLSADYNGRNVLIRDVRAVSDVFSASGDAITVRLPQDRGRILMEAKNLSGSYPDIKAALKGLDFIVSMSGGEKDLSGDLSFAARQITINDSSSGPIVGKGSLSGNEFILDIPSARLFGGSVRILAKGRSADSPFPIALTLTAEKINLGSVSHAAESFLKTPYAVSGSAESLSFEGSVSSSENINGRAAIRGKDISITDAERKALLKDVMVSSDIVFQGRNMDMKADASAGGLLVTLSGSADHIFEADRTLRMSILMPEVKISDIRTAFWDITPDRLLYAGMNGSIAMNLLATYSRSSISADGRVLLKDIAIEGENNEYSLGPINGMLPIHFSSAGNELDALSIPSFDRPDFEDLRKLYTETKKPVGDEIRIGSVRYGFRLLEDLSLWVEQKGSSLKINRFSAKMFGGEVNGTGFVDLSDGFSYRAGVITDGVSLTQLCEEIAPIKGYISGRIDGIATIKGSGAGLANIIGKADFWTYSTEGERTRISREFLEKIGGPQLKAYLGERRFNKGVMGLYIQNGFIIFRELEISNRNLVGITDLSVKVAPLNNRIAIDHLMWTITEAALRAKKE